MNTLEKYLKMTGQTLGEVMQGASTYGPAFIEELVEKALKEKKKIIWKPNLVAGQDVQNLFFETRRPEVHKAHKEGL